MKRCTKCQQDKPISAYSPEKLGKDGLRSVCKVCSGAQTKISRAKDPNYKAKDREVHNAKYGNNPEFREATIKRVREYRQANQKILTSKQNQRAKEHNYAHQVVYQAVKSGKLLHISTQICIKCNQPAEHYHHHNGYDKAHVLDVIPLCRKHHEEIHRIN